MLKKIFTKIEKGINDFSNEELAQLEPFLKEEIIIRKDNNIFETNSKYKIATVKINKNTATLKDLSNEYKDIRIDFENLEGAYDNDLVLAKGFLIQEVEQKQKL